MFPFKYCRNCKYCRLDIKALNIGVLIDKCGLHDCHLLYPFLFRCKDWRKNNGK